MSQRSVPFVEREFYHIYNRGNSKQVIFRDDHDYQRFQQLLFFANGTTPFVLREIEGVKISDFDRGQQQVGIGAYCLMPNHFHILLTPASEKGVQTFMLKLSTGYAMYFNRKYERTGSLFEGKYKSKHAHSDEYLKYLFSYIHLNPVKLIQSNWKEDGIVDRPGALSYLDTYQFSSYSEYNYVEREESYIIDRDVFPKYFDTPQTFRSEIFEWLDLERDAKAKLLPRGLASGK